MKAQKSSFLFKIMSDDSKLKIIEYLLENDSSNCSEISEHIKKDITTTSRHLERLKRAGLIITEKQGRCLICSLRNRAAIKQFLQISSRIYGD